MRTNIYAKDSERAVLQGDEWFIFKEGMHVAIPSKNKKCIVKEVIFVLAKPNAESNLVSMSQEVFLDDEKEE